MINVFNLFKRSKTRREILVNVERLETRVAVIENGRLEEFMVEHPEEERLVGSVFKGRVQNLENDLQAAFVDIGLKKNAFLHYWDMTPDADALLDFDEDEGEGKGKGSRKSSRLSDAEIAKRFPPGSEIIVQVTKGPISTKGPRVTANLSIPGRYLVMMPGTKIRGVSKKIGDANERKRLKKILDRLPLPENCGLVVRTVGAGASARAFARDLRNLIAVWNEMQANVKNLRTPCCIFQEPDLCERVVRDWLTEEVDAIIIDDEKSFNEMREVTGRISRRAKAKIRRYDGDSCIFDHYGLERQLSEAFSRYPFHNATLHSGPHHWGPANPLYPEPTGRAATMVGFPFDDLKSWRSIFPAETYISRCREVAEGFDEGSRIWKGVVAACDGAAREQAELEYGIIRTVALHMASCADQSRFVLARDRGDRGEMRAIARRELARAKELLPIVERDSRLGYECSCHYFYTPQDLREKILNCRQILDGE